MAKKSIHDYEQVEVLTRAELREWLAANHSRTESVWLISHKKSSPHYLHYDSIVEEALCFGWIDSTVMRLDEQRSMLLFAPRRKGSVWSRVNKERIERLKEAGLIEQPGLDAIERAKQDGSWSFLDDVEALVVPPDLQAELAANPPALDYWEEFAPSAKRNILAWVKMAKRDATRAARIAKTVELAKVNLRARHPEAEGLKCAIRQSRIPSGCGFFEGACVRISRTTPSTVRLGSGSAGRAAGPLVNEGV